jgi:uncharacterized protein (TIGR02284 family)
MDMDSASISALEELVHVNLDSYRGYKELSSRIDNADCRTLFREIASRQRTHADLLLRHMRLREQDLAPRVSVKRALHRWWLNLRTSLDATAPSELLAQAEHGEEELERCYERLYQSLSEGTVRDVLGAQCREVRRDHHRIHALSARIARPS